MAWFFELAAECGDDRAAAESLAAFFDGCKWHIPGAPSFDMLVQGSAQTGESGRWWALAVPTGLSTSGSGDPEDARRMTEVGYVLYDRLRLAPPYRFAAVGVETFDFRDVEDLPEVLSFPAIAGLVLAEALWAQFGRPANFVPFAKGYWWVPYRGEFPFR